MKIEIWSDILCPFCYIGKRHLEQALSNYPGEHFDIEWKSFQLDPTSVPTPNKSVYDYLAEKKGMTIHESKMMHDQVAQRAKEAGLSYHFEKTIVANSLNAHRLLQFAKEAGKSNELEEAFFQAYFTDGLDLNDHDTLHRLCVQVGMDSDKVKQVLQDSKLFSLEVQSDIREAQQIGVRGVPFFVFDRKYAVSGAQPVNYFKDVIEACLNRK